MKRKLLLLVVAAVTFLGNAVNAQIVFNVLEPSSLAGPYNFTYADQPTWGYDMTMQAVTDTLIMADDGTAADSLACNALVNNVAGKIVVLYRGSCEFGVKAKNAQDAGAVAVIIINNIPGGPVGMGAGAQGANVNIPVIMISQADGALLRPEIEAGNVVAFIGNKSGAFANDLGFQKKDIVMSRSFSIPAAVARDNSDFQIPVGAWVFNYGQNSQTNVMLNATVKLGGNTLYNETSTPTASLVAGDSIFISLPVFAKPAYDIGYYTLTYTITSDLADDYSGDNSLTSNFWINNELYSKSSVDPTGKKTTTNFYRSGATEFTWCTVLKEKNASRLKADAISFAANPSQTGTLVGKSVLVEFYQWNDPTDATYDDLVLLESPIYTYSANLRGEFIKVPFTAPITLIDNQRYLSCVHIVEDSLYIGTDESLDYETTINEYQEIMFPLLTDRWYGGGFGSDLVPAIFLHTIPVDPCINFAVTTTAVNGTCTTPASITANVSGGTAPFSYLWSNGGTGSSISSLTTGTYTVTVIDANNCTKTSSASVTAVPIPVVSITGTTATCGGSDATATATVTGGSAPFTYAWSTTPVQTDAVATGLAADIYSVTVTDASGCTDTETITISNTGGPSVSGVTTMPTCNGGNNGAINVTVTGGTPNYTYSWSNGATTEDISGLTAGIYTLRATDASGCITFYTDTVTSPPAITITETHIDNTTTGSINITVNNGTDPFTFSWNGPSGFTSSSEDLSGLTARGNYNVVVTDFNACTATLTISMQGSIGINESSKSVNAVSIYPNPASSAATLAYELASSSNVMLKVFDVTGKEVMALTEGNKTAGLHLIPVNTSVLPSGVYYYTLTVNDYNITKKLVIVKK